MGFQHEFCRFDPNPVATRILCAALRIFSVLNLFILARRATGRGMVASVLPVEAPATSKTLNPTVSRGISKTVQQMVNNGEHE